MPNQPWTPNPGPQTEALECQADILFYGGSAGSGKTDLLLGLGATEHRRSIIFRREFPQMKGMLERATEVYGSIGTWNLQSKRWRLRDGRSIEFDSVQFEEDKLRFQGRDHDLKAFDEISHFTETQFRFIIGWNRSTLKGQRCRIVAAGNPPTTAEGDWVVRFWAAWLDKSHPNPAKSGEIRWYITVDGKDIEVPDGSPVLHPEGRISPKTGQIEIIKPLSRCFIAGTVWDNPDLADSGYIATLQALPEPLRSQMLFGDFHAGQDDDPWQVIPTAWIQIAQARWQPNPPSYIDALGVDVARGGSDKTVLTPRHGNWFGVQKCYAGSTTPDGNSVVAAIAEATVPYRPFINVDVIGVGASVYDTGRDKGLKICPMNGSNTSINRDMTGELGFINKRAEWYWVLREALDPLTGQELSLPPDRELLADLTAPRWKLVQRGIQVESKEDIKKRIGRSPDKGDSLVYAFAIEVPPGTNVLEYMKASVNKTIEGELTVPAPPALPFHERKTPKPELSPRDELEDLTKYYKAAFDDLKTEETGCATCGKPVLGTRITDGVSLWHPDCRPRN